MASRTVPVYFDDMLIPGILVNIDYFGGRWEVRNLQLLHEGIVERIRQLADLEPYMYPTIRTVGEGGVVFSLGGNNNNMPAAVAGAAGAAMNNEYNYEAEIAAAEGGAPAAAAGAGAGAGGANIYAGAPHIGKLNIVQGTTSPIGLSLPKDGTEMVNFHGEHGHGRVYTKEEFNSLPKNLDGRKRNPITRQVIKPGNVRYYTASRNNSVKNNNNNAMTGGQRRKTRKHKKRNGHKKKRT